MREMDLNGALVANHSRQAWHGHDSSSLGGFWFGGLKSWRQFPGSESVNDRWTARAFEVHGSSNCTEKVSNGG